MEVLDLENLELYGINFYNYVQSPEHRMVIDGHFSYRKQPICGSHR